MIAEINSSGKPLSGKRILITRAREQADDMVRALTDLGAEVINIPTIEINPPQSFQPLDRALVRANTYHWLILTSVNGVRAMAKRAEKNEVDLGLLRTLKIAAIGPATADEIRLLGLKPELVPDEYVAESVVAALKGKVFGKKVLLVRAKVARDVIPDSLRAAGAEVDVVEAYETGLPVNSIAKIKALLAAGEERPDVITFTSPSTVKNFITALGQGASPKTVLEGIVLASIGPVTTASMLENGLRADVVAKEYTAIGLVESLKEYFVARK